MGAIKLIITAWLAVFLQSAAIHYLGVWGNMPDLITLAVAGYTLRSGGARGMAFGALTGFLADCYRPDTMGILTLSGITVGWLAGVLRERIYREHPLSQMVLAGGLVLIRQPFEFLGTAGGSLTAYPWFLIRHGLGSALYTSLLAYWLLPLISRWLQRNQNPRLSHKL